MIVASAILYPNGEVLTAHRHFQIVEMQAKFGIKTQGDAIQGFVDHTGKFYTREEAKTIAVKNNQIPKYFRGVLHSEDLWPDTLQEVN